jgi:hypothetical protein
MKKADASVKTEILLGVLEMLTSLVWMAIAIFLFMASKNITHFKNGQKRPNNNLLIFVQSKL